MKKMIMFFVAFMAMAVSTVHAQWKADPAHTEVGFKITHLGISTISGTFNEFEATITSSKPDFSDAQITMSANINSIDTRVEARDNHLKSADFFDAQKHPKLTFKGTSIKSLGMNKYKVLGNMTIHGVTKPVELEMIYQGTTTNPQSKKPTAGFSFKGQINRADFNIGGGFGPPMIGEEVKIYAHAEFIK